MKYDPLVIGDLVAKVPLIQGGMGVGVSLSGLAGAVAKEGGVGIISTAQIGFREPDYEKNPLEANLRAVKSEIIKAKEINSVKGNVDEGLIFCGADTWKQNRMQSVKEVIQELFG